MPAGDGAGRGVAPRPRRARSEQLIRRVQTVFGPKRPESQAELIEVLNEVADAISTAVRVGEVLDIIIERVKRISGTDKAVLVLTEEHGEGLDVGTIIVRGRRDQHAQQWWETRINDIATRRFLTPDPIVEMHQDHNAILVCSPILVKNGPIGFIVAINELDRPFNRQQIDFLAIVSAFASSAIENAKLTEQVQNVLLASERDRIARAMHDGVVQSLFSISLGLEVCKKQTRTDPDGVAQRLDELQRHLNLSMAELRRFIYDLRPAGLTELGLVGATEFWLREITVGRPVAGRLEVSGAQPSLSPSVETCLYRVTKEAVSNVVKHASATEFTVRFHFSADVARVEIEDDGVGFDTSKVFNGSLEQIGLRSIKQRVEHENGTLRIESARGKGTKVTVELRLRGDR